MMHRKQREISRISQQKVESRSIKQNITKIVYSEIGLEWLDIKTKLDASFNFILHFTLQNQLIIMISNQYYA